MTPEWSVMVTDWLLAAVCMRLARSLWRYPYRAQHRVAAAFTTAAVAACIGGVRHGIGPWLPADVCAVLRFFSYALLPPAVALLLLGVKLAGARRSWWFIGGVAVGVSAAAVQQGVPFGTDGTLHNDLFHLLMIPSVYAFYRAALLFREASDAPSHR